MKTISKGQKLPLEKELSSKSFKVALNWDQSSAPNYELDTSVMLLASSGKLENENNFVFYNNLVSPCGGVKLEGNSSNYKKSFSIDLNKIANDVSRMIFLITIDNGDELNQRFNSIKNISATILENNAPALEYKVEDLTKETAIIIIEIYKHNNEWKIQATGTGFNSGLAAILAQYGSDAVAVEDAPPVTQVSSQPVQQNTPTIQPQQNNFTPPVVSPSRPKSTASKTPKGNPDFIRDYNRRLEVVNRELAMNNLSAQKAQVVIALDLSVSMGNMLRNGTVQDTLDKILPLAMQLDDDGSIDIFPFHDEAFNHDLPFTMDNRDKYIQYEILFKYYLAGANYAPVINKISTKYSQAGKCSDPVYVIFFTDGDCADNQNAENAMRDASTKGIFWQFIGIEGNPSSFAFLNKLDNLSGRKVDNANFCHIPDLNRITDEQLYSKLLKEFPIWLKDAKNQGIIN